MSGANAEIKPETGAPADAGAATVAAPDKSATPEAAKSTARPETTSSGDSTPDVKERARQAFTQREQKREKKASEELAEARKELDSLRAKLTAKPEAKPDPVNFLDNPDQWAKETREAATREAVEAIRRENTEAVANYEYDQAAERAADFILTRSHLKEDKALREQALNLLQQDKRLSRIGAYDPESAAELAYVRVCQSKGIVPDMDGFKSAGLDASRGAASAGVRTSAPGTGKRIWGKGEARSELSKLTPGSPEHRALTEEVNEAYKEGRIQR